MQELFEIRSALMNSVVYTPIYVPFHTNVDACEGVASIGKTYCANDYSEFKVGATAHDNGLATKHVRAEEMVDRLVTMVTSAPDVDENVLARSVCDDEYVVPQAMSTSVAVVNSCSKKVSEDIAETDTDSRNCNVTCSFVLGLLTCKDWRITKKNMDALIGAGTKLRLMVEQFFGEALSVHS